MLRYSLPAALCLALLAARPAVSVLTDDEPSNDSIGTAAVQIVPSAAATADAGALNLVPDDIDYIGIGNLAVGDIVTVSTTPLGGSGYEVPDTFIGLFTSGGSRECENDDISNNELWNPPSTGFGSLCRFVIDSAGTWFVGVTGASDPPFEPPHYHTGTYELHVTINALVPPMPTPTGTPMATPTATPTPTPEPGVLLQLLSGGVGLAWLQRRRNRRVSARSRS